jgi:hypothetical protein
VRPSGISDRPPRLARSSGPAFWAGGSGTGWGGTTLYPKASFKNSQDLEVEPSTYNFEEVPEGDRVDAVFNIRNVTTRRMTVTVKGSCGAKLPAIDSSLPKSESLRGRDESHEGRRYTPRMQEGWPPAQKARVGILLRTLPTLTPDARRLLMYQLRFEADEGGSSKAYLIPVFEQGLKDTESEVRLHSVMALPAVESSSGLAALVTSLYHQDADVRYYAACGLRGLGLQLPEVNASAIAALHKALSRSHEADPDVEVAMAHALVALGERLDGNVFIQALRREGANWALASEGLVLLRRRDAIVLLIRRLDTGTFDPRYIADALEKLTGQTFGRDEKLWTDWYQKNASELPPQVE